MVSLHSVSLFIKPQILKLSTLIRFFRQKTARVNNFFACWTDRKLFCYILYTAVSRKVVGKSARDNPERYCGWFLVHCLANGKRGHGRMFARAKGKQQKYSRFDLTASRTNVLIISYITFRDCRVHSFCDNLPRNSCILKAECR